MISPDEQAFVEEGVRSGLRNDGRGIAEARPFTLTSGIFAHTFGSARIVVGGPSKAEIIVACKGNLGETPSLSGFVHLMNRERREIEEELSELVQKLMLD
jgi:exosome complex RNA-binding protein Rrp42 (RNase PH superfamily)